MSHSPGVDGSNSIKPASQSELERIHAEAEKFRMVSRSQKFHLIREDAKRKCRDRHTPNRDSDYRNVKSATLPVGHREVCRVCLDEWRGEQAETKGSEQ